MRYRMKLMLAALVALGLAGCDVVVVQDAPVSAPTAAPKPAPITQTRDGRVSARNFVQVVETVEPVAERFCRQQAPRLNCDFRIVIDDRPNMPPNAFQTVDEQGRPIIAFTLALIADAQNVDELAFVLSHEAAHHIAGHLDRQRQNATVGALVFGQLAGVTGGGEDAVRVAQELGAQVGARTYSKDFELEADALGTRIAARAGYDPVRGAEFFFRIPDPGDRFLGTHPPNAERVEIVRRTVAGL